MQSNFNLNYKKDINPVSGFLYYNITENNSKVGLLEFSNLDVGIIQIVRLYLEKEQMKKGYGNKIIFDLLNYTKAHTLILKPFNLKPWSKKGFGFAKDYPFPVLEISKNEFLRLNFVPNN